VRNLICVFEVFLVFFSLAAFNKAPVLVRSQGEGKAPVIQEDRMEAFKVALKDALMSSLGKEVSLLMSDPEEVEAFKQAVDDRVYDFVVKYRVSGFEYVNVGNEVKMETDASSGFVVAEQPEILVVRVEAYIDSSYLQERIREYDSLMRGLE